MQNVSEKAPVKDPEEKKIVKDHKKKPAKDGRSGDLVNIYYYYYLFIYLP